MQSPSGEQFIQLKRGFNQLSHSFDNIRSNIDRSSRRQVRIRLGELQGKLKQVQDALGNLNINQLSNMADYYELRADISYTLADVIYHDVMLSSNQLHNSGNYQAWMNNAAVDYSKAYDVKPHGRLLLSMANCHYWLADACNNQDQAVAYYKKVLYDYYQYLSSHQLSLPQLSIPDLLSCHTALYEIVRSDSRGVNGFVEQLSFINKFIKQHKSYSSDVDLDNTDWQRVVDYKPQSSSQLQTNTHNWKMFQYRINDIATQGYKVKLPQSTCSYAQTPLTASNESYATIMSLFAGQEHFYNQDRGSANFSGLLLMDEEKENMPSFWGNQDENQALSSDFFQSTPGVTMTEETFDWVNNRSMGQ